VKDLLAVAVVICSAMAQADEQIALTLPFDEAWRRANQAVALQGAAITTSNKDGGVIIAESKDGAQPGWFECPKGQGRPLSFGYKITITLNQLDGGQVAVHAVAAGVNVWYRNHHVLFIRAAKHRTWVDCLGSTGVLERSVLARVAGTSSTN
jgi:hypothetical protein